MENYNQTQQSSLFTPEQIKQLSNYLNSDENKSFISYQTQKDHSEKIDAIMPHNPIYETNELLQQQNKKVDILKRLKRRIIKANRTTTRNHYRKCKA